jgi:predicted esterase YcpF (UPF0227 family)
MVEKLYYIHGYLSDPNSTKGTLFKEKLNAKAIKYRDCEPEDLVIPDCVSRIKEEINDEAEVVLIGSSLGGLLAVKTALEVKNIKVLILLNPAIVPMDVDISKIQGMPKDILADMQDPQLFSKKIFSDIFVLLGMQDDVVPNSWGEKFAEKQGGKVLFFDDDHSFTHNLNRLPDIIGSIIYKKH